MSDFEAAYSDYAGRGLRPIKCFPNSFRPISSELASGITDEDEAGWSDYNIGIRAGKALSALVFEHYADYKNWDDRQLLQGQKAPVIVHPDNTISVWFENTDWQPQNFDFGIYKLVNVGILPAPPSIVGEVEVTWMIDSDVLPSTSFAYPTAASPLKPFAYGEDVIPIKGFLSFSFPKPQPYMADGLLDDQAKIAIAGEPKIGKSRFALNFAFCLATGQDFMDIAVTRPARVLFVQFEVSEARFQERVIGLADAFGLPSDTNIPLFFKSIPGIRLDSDEGIARLKRFIRDCKPDIVFLDPLYKIHGLEENSSSEMQSHLFDRLDNLIYEHGITIIVLHHVNKRSDARGWTRVRGSGQLPAWVDGLITMDNPVFGGEKIEVVALLRSGPGFVKTITFNDQHIINEVSDSTMMEVFCADLLISDPGISRKQMASKVARSFGISVREVNEFLEKLEEKGYILPDS